MSADHHLTIELSTEEANTLWAQRRCIDDHYLHKVVSPKARPMLYVINYGAWRVGLVIVSHPHAPRCAGWWGYPGLPTQWQVVDICRIWLDPVIQVGGRWCEFGRVPGYIDRHHRFRSTAATWAIHQVLARVQSDRVRLYPPVYPDEPYHIRLAISYHDPQYHRGTIYRQSGAAPMYTDADGQPQPGPSGKYGWCWQLPQPSWQWHDLDNIHSRTLRLF